ncbi:ubiquitin-like protein Mdy2p [[Candida] anglica]|uniref:Ubiquitin-like protein Mdy2p n=1 Tax=[Candida] anglica TaxID=148631 RepID=A0ABP0EH76_9ASCO
MTTVERPFASAFLELISLSEDAGANEFYSTTEYGKLASLGPTLPKLKAVLPKKGAETSVAETRSFKLSFKSIKPPFKFSTQLVNVPETHTVYKVKSDLVEALPLLKDAGVTASDIKMLVKGKVIPDTSALSIVAVAASDEISFMCMVSPPKPQEVNTVEATPSTLDDPETVSPAAFSPGTIPQGTWTKLKAVLVEDLGSANAEIAFERLQKSVN